MPKVVKTKILLILMLIFSSCSPYLGENFQTEEVNANNERKIKVSAYHETGGFFISGAGYIFESIDKSNGIKTEILRFRHDDPIDIPLENIIVKSDKLSYFWIGWVFAVSSDGGKNWNVWDATHHEGFDINYGLIETVEIDSDGKGKMFFNDLAIERTGISFLTTNNYGKTLEKS